MILDLFGEKETPASALGDCCDVCRSPSEVSNKKIESLLMLWTNLDIKEK